MNTRRQAEWDTKDPLKPHLSLFGEGQGVGEDELVHWPGLWNGVSQSAQHLHLALRWHQDLR